MNKIVTVVLFLLLVSSSVALAEPPEYRELRDQDAAGRWTEQQYRRADDFERRGESQRAQEVREYGEQRSNFNRELSDIVRDNWPGDR
ncbi:MAG: hypothetical protein OEX11_08645 [Nitrosomonas sp.]|nr:hypothetical protein [Nitrosomonas sp.]